MCNYITIVPYFTRTWDSEQVPMPIHPWMRCRYSRSVGLSGLGRVPISAVCTGALAAASLQHIGEAIGTADTGTDLEGPVSET